MVKVYEPFKHRFLIPSRVALFLYFIVASVPSFLSAQNFGFSPNSTGQLDPWVQVQWNWTGTISGGARLESRSGSTIDDTPLEGLEQFITTVQQQYQVQLTPARYSQRFGPNDNLRIGLGLSVLADFFDITENGFIDLSNDEAESIDRLFFFNQRKNRKD